jgi:hypothetical protein
VTDSKINKTASPIIVVEKSELVLDVDKDLTPEQVEYLNALIASLDNKEKS